MSRRLQLDLPEEDTQIDMTPMLDIVFIMLIFFIVSTTFIREAGVKVERPESSTASATKPESIPIALTAAGEIWLDQQPLDIGLLAKRLSLLHREQPQASLLIQADKRAHTGLLIQVLDTAKAAGIQEIAVATQQGEG
ncbi:biopolymer transport protein ExbD [Allopseudospirillum japonicum]|uniref:Biopolymer transport protein ExbD n=1 Tax=Allopseudospirillum japonicum TaxID=64971 RepID=A0A1H6TTC2_9GAMM|nr:biopolymer transporter ExbD [Allopseudospirillum japonicum]SEI83319.1 biopolymer transport protein ExbD [Allopseudospirillum japonicum]